MSPIKISNSKIDLEYMMKTLDIARQNPDKTINKAVGALIVKDNQIVGRGYRVTKVLQQEPYKDITYHAEHQAILEAGENARRATLYATLEPCTYRSKGPGWDAPDPCVKLIYEAGIKRVVIGILDEDFGAGGINYLTDKGIIVEVCNGIDKKYFEELINDPKIDNEKARKLQEEMKRSLENK